MELLRIELTKRNAPEASNINKYMYRLRVSPVLGGAPGFGGVVGFGGLSGFRTFVITNPILASPVIVPV